jgi:hypothetical protein
VILTAGERAAIIAWLVAREPKAFERALLALDQGRTGQTPNTR